MRLRHCVQNRECTDHVVLVVRQWFFDRLTHRFVRSKVNNGLDVVGFEHIHQSSCVQYILLNHHRFHARDGFDALCDFGRGVGKIIEQNRRVPRFNQHHCSVRTNITCAACE